MRLATTRALSRVPSCEGGAVVAISVFGTKIGRCQGELAERLRSRNMELQMMSCLEFLACGAGVLGVMRKATMRTEMHTA